MKKKLLFTLAVCLVSLIAISQHQGKASFYSKRATGARTSSGVRMHHDSLMCAHRTYPFGTKLNVRNLRNNKTVVVTVVDRGPHIRGRILDLSYAAAKELDMISQGIAMVEITVHSDIPYALPKEELPIIEFEAVATDSVVDFRKFNPAWRQADK